MKALAITLTFCITCGVAGQNNQKLNSRERRVDSAAAEVFSANCAGCHGLDGKGGERAPDIVTQPNTRQLSDSQLLQILKKGIPRKSMPAFNDLGEDTLRSMVAYLRALQGSAPTALVGNAINGEKVFFGRGGCSNCHMVRGKGGFYSSDLTAYAQSRSSQTVRDAILFPNRNLNPRSRKVQATQQNGRTIEGVARNEDNFTIQILSPDGVLHFLDKSDLTSLSYSNESAMPADYATTLSSAELDDLISYLYSVSEKEPKGKKNGKDSDEE
jgi:cytochrome c oxidase cbb3-type subunit III